MEGPPIFFRQPHEPSLPLLNCCKEQLWSIRTPCMLLRKFDACSPLILTVVRTTFLFAVPPIVSLFPPPRPFLFFLYPKSSVLLTIESILFFGLTTSRFFSEFACCFPPAVFSLISLSQHPRQPCFFLLPLLCRNLTAQICLKNSVRLFLPVDRIECILTCVTMQAPSSRRLSPFSFHLPFVQRFCPFVLFSKCDADFTIELAFFPFLISS